MSLSKPFSGKESVPIPSYKDKINKNTQQCTKFVDLTSPYELGFRALKIKVIPQLEVVDFYHGGRAPEYEYDPKVYERTSQVTATDIKTIMSTFKSGQISFVGPAGSGKTTLLKLISNQVLAKEYENLAEVEVVHYIQCRDLRRSDKTTIKKFLFHNTNPSIGPEDKNEMTEFALKKPEKVLFVLDSLDTLQYTIDGVYENITMEDRASPEVVLWNFLSGNLFPGCRIITSSRDHSIRNYKGNVRAGSVIALVGLTPDSMKQIISGYLGEEEATQIMEYLKTNAPSLYSLCSTPAFLAFTLISLKSNVGFVPNTMSGIMAALLQCLIRSPHALVENIEEVVKILQKLAFAGTEERRVLFSVDELASYGLRPDEVKDLTIFVPGGVAQKVLVGSYLLYFSHQTLQEWLTALHIAEMPPDDFKQFLSSHIHTAHFHIVRRFLCGILLHPDIIKAMALGDSDDAGFQRQEKCKLLMDNLEQKLQDLAWDKSFSSDVRRNLLELFTAITEAGDGMKDIVSSCISEIDMTDIPLSTTDAHVLASTAATSSALNKIELHSCSLNADALNAMWNSLKVADVKVSALIVSGGISGEEGFFYLGKLVERCDVKILELGSCFINAAAMDKFLAGAGNAKVLAIGMSENRSLGEEGFIFLGKLLEQCEAQELTLQECGITALEMSKFLAGVGNAKLATLDMGYNKTLGEEGFFQLGKLLAWCEVTVVGLRSCDVTDMEMNRLLDGCESAKITELDINDNTTMGEEGYFHLGKLVEQCGVKILDLYGCNITATKLGKFMAGAGSAKIARLEMGNNKSLGEEGFYHLGRLVRQCEVAELRLRKCNITTVEMSKLVNGAGKAKIRILDVSFNESLSEEGFFHLGMLAEQCLVKELEMSYCGITALGVSKLLAGVGNAKVTRLNMSNHKSMGEEGFFLLAKLVKHCGVKILELWNCDITVLEIDKFLADAGNAQITALDISFNKKIGEDGFLHIGRLVDQCDIEELKLMDCGITAVEMRKFMAGVGNAKLMKLDVSDNESLSEEGFFHLGKLIEQCEVQELEMWNCGVTGQKLSKFAAGAGNAKIRRLVLSNNKTLVKKGFFQLGRVVERCRIRELELWSCGANARTLTQFLDSSGSAKLSSLEINLSEFGREDVGLLKQLLQRVDDYIIVHQTDISLIGRVVAEGDQVWRQEFEEEDKIPRSIRYTRIKPISDNQDNVCVTDVETLQEKKTEPGPTLEKTSVKRKVIGMSGGNIELRGNKVTFPEGALLEDTNVTVSLSYDPCMWPEGFICLAPVLDCDLSGATLQTMAEVEMTTWCTTDEEGVLMHVMGRSDEDGNWRILEDIPITNVRKVFYKTSHFSPVTIAGLIAYVLGLFGRRAAPLDFRVSNQVFYDEKGLFVSVLYLDNENDIRKDMKNKGCEELLPLSETITTRIDDNIEVKLCSDDEPFRFMPGEGQSVPVAEIVENVKKQKLYKLQPRPQPGYLDMTYKLLYGAAREIKHSLPIHWPLRTFSQDPGNAAGPGVVHHHHGAELRVGHLAANQLAIDRGIIGIDGDPRNAAGI